ARITGMIPASPTCDQVSLLVKHAHATSALVRSRFARARPAPRAKTQFRDKRWAQGIKGDVRWSGQGCPLADVFAARRELLDPGVFPIADVDDSRGVDGDAMRHMKLSGSVARFAPRSNQNPVM